jgi:hypothetical protein
MQRNKRNVENRSLGNGCENKKPRLRRHSLSTLDDVDECSEAQPIVALKNAGSSAFKNGLMKTVTWTPRTVCYSLDAFLETLSVKTFNVLEPLRKTPPNSLKVYIDVQITYCNAKNQDDVFNVALRSKVKYVLVGSDLKENILSILDQIKDRNANSIRNKSGAVIKSVDKATLNYARYNALRGASFVELPEAIKRKKAVINVKNTDNRCFGYAILACKYANDAYEKNRSEPKQYDKHFIGENLADLDYPVKLADLEKIERELRLPINVVSFYDDKGTGMYSVYHSKLDANAAVNLLYWKGHYAWIRNFERLMSGVTNHQGRKHFCMRCFCHFSSPEVLKVHEEICTGDTCKQIMTMVPEGTTLKFRNTRYQQLCPFVIYADFECLPRNCTDVTFDENDPLDVRPGSAYQKHEPCSAGILLVSTISEVKVPYEEHFGRDVVSWFLRRLLEIETSCLEVLFDDKRLRMTEENKVRFQSATECYLCMKKFSALDYKVRDHDHLSGLYRGAAHRSCNLLLRKQYKIPVFLHNFRGYDCHVIVTALGEHKNKKLNIIGQGMEKYLTLSFGDHLTFKDSLQFLSESLETLVESLSKSGKEKFTNLREGFSQESEDTFDLLLRKGVYPYDYINAWERFDEDKLPPIEAFSSRLRQEHCERSSYEHAELVWRAFGCQRLKDYHDIYLKTDVLLLADVFEEFRKVCMNVYKLDPAHYVSAPQLSWDAMLKMTECELDLISDSEMYRMVNGSLRGGISMICKRFSRANNERLGQIYDENKPVKHLVYWDANNLYGWAMSQFLPMSGFRWMSKIEFEQIDWITLKKDSPVGYIIECDLDYPDELHDAHNEYPLAPERVKVCNGALGEMQHNMRTKYTFERNTSYAKLVPNLFPKKFYTVHYRNLKFYLKHGMILVKVHRVIEFQQAAWMKKYIETNQDLRAASKHEFEKKFYKGMNNSCYGKTCENQQKRTDIKLVADEEKALQFLSMPHLLGFRVFDSNLAAVNLMKPRCLINRPFYVGFAVLELSKLHMYKFHYDFVKQRWPGERSQLLFTDTDSLMYEIQDNNLFETVWAYRDRFDLSDYPKDFYYDSTNNKVIGKFKDETNSKPLLEFVGLRPKMYSFLTISDTLHSETSEKMRAKGIQRAAMKRLRHADFLKQLHDPIENSLTNRRIGTKLHKIFTYEYQKRGLCAYDDKRYIQEDGITTLAYGHSRIRGNQALLPDANDRCNRVIESFEETKRNGRLSEVLDKEADFPGGLDPDQTAAEIRKRNVEDLLSNDLPVNMRALVDFAM